jgi:hypothetical protein
LRLEALEDRWAPSVTSGIDLIGQQSTNSDGTATTLRTVNDLAAQDSPASQITDARTQTTDSIAPTRDTSAQNDAGSGSYTVTISRIDGQNARGIPYSTNGDVARRQYFWFGFVENDALPLASSAAAPHKANPDLVEPPRASADALAIDVSSIPVANAGSVSEGRSLPDEPPGPSLLASLIHGGGAAALTGGTEPESASSTALDLEWQAASAAEAASEPSPTSPTSDAVAPAAPELLAGLLPFDPQALDRAVQQVLGQLRELGQSAEQAIQGANVTPWALAAGAGVAALEVRRRRRRASASASSLTDETQSWTWIPGMSGIEEV